MHVSRLKAFAAVSLLALLGSCGDGGSATPKASTRSATETSASSETEPTISSATFSVAFSVRPPTWSNGPLDPEERNFATWVSADDAHAIRFLAPVSIYRRGTAKPVSVPTDYLRYLLDLGKYGAKFVDLTKTTVGGQPATVMNASVVGDGLDGSLGCQEHEMSPADCYGLQPDKPLRLAVVTVKSRLLLIWLRANVTDTQAGRSKDDDAFDAMLASLHFT